MFQIALSLQNPDGGQNRVVGQSGLLSNRIKHLLNRARALEPEHIHDPQLGFGQSSRLSRWHRRPSMHLRRFTKRKVTNSLVAREKSRVARLANRIRPQQDVMLRRGRAKCKWQWPPVRRVETGTQLPVQYSCP